MNKWIALTTLLTTCIGSTLLTANVMAAEEAGHGATEGEVLELVTGNVEAGQAAAAVCAACHGGNGMAIQPEYPNLAGQHAAYLAKQLQDYRDGTRANAIMAPQAANLSDEAILDISAYFAAMPKMQGVAEEQDLALGESIYRGGITSAGIPACTGCHGPSGLGNPSAAYPMLSGQNAAYTALQLRYFRSGERNNDPNRMMSSLAHRLSDAEIDAVSNYIAGLFPRETP